MHILNAYCLLLFIDRTPTCVVDAALMRLWKKCSLSFAFLLKFVVPFALKHGKNLMLTVILGFGQRINF